MTALCGAYDKLIQFYSLIHCNTYSYNASFFKVCIVQPHKASFYPQTRRFLIQTEVWIPSECGAYDKLIQFYSLIQCNTYWYIASFFKFCIVQPYKASFYPQTLRFQYNFRFKSCPLAKVHEVDTILQESVMQQPTLAGFLLTSRTLHHYGIPRIVASVLWREADIGSQSANGVSFRFQPQ